MKLLLIDGHSLAYRAFYALPLLSMASGVPTQALLGVVNMTLKILEDEKPTHMMVFFDREIPAFRKDAYVEYKATRKAAPDDFTVQMPFIEDFFRTMEIPVIAEPGYEADDWIASVVKKAEPNADEILILSADLDLLQLVSGKTVVLASKQGTSSFTRYTPAEVEKKLGVPPAGVTELKALIGDASDNIPGVPGLGPKTAADLLKKFGSAENVLEHLDELPPKQKEKISANRAQILLSHDLVTLRSDAPVEFHPELCLIPPLGRTGLKEFFEKFELRKLASRPEFQSDAAVETVEFRLVSDEAELDALASAFGRSAQAALMLWPSPSPFFGEHHLSVELGGEGRFVVPPHQAARALRRLFEDRAGREIFTHNWKAFELARREFEIAAPRWKVDDALITGWLCNSLRTYPAIPDLSRDYLQLRVPDFAGKNEREEDVLPVLAHWISVLPNLGKAIGEKVRGYGMEELYRGMEFPLIGVLADMELNGVAIDLPFLARLSDELKEEMARLEGEIYKEAGLIFNLNSSKQLADVLYHKLQLPPGKKLKTGYSTDVDELERLSQFSTLPAKLLQYREVSKLENTYVDVFPKLVNPRTGRIHTTYIQTGSSTGRLASKDPNIQNIPIRSEYGKRIRASFVPGKPGWKIVSADYSQIELRLLAHFSKDPVLTDAFQSGEDIHTRTASEVFGVPKDSVTSEMRRMAKVVNFGIIYGMTEHGLSQNLGMKREDAREYIKKYMDRFPKVEAYIQAALEEARGSGVTRTISGRLRFMPELQSRNSYLRQQAERIGINAPLQGSAADLIKIAMIRVKEKLPDGVLLIMQVHDELVLEVPAEAEKGVASLVKEEMENAAKLEVPLTVDVASGDNWADMQGMDEEELKTR